MAKPLTILLLLRRLDCNDGVASYCETLVKGMASQGDRVVILSGPVTQLYGSEVRHSAIAAAALDWIVVEDLKARMLGIAVFKVILRVINLFSVDVIAVQGFSKLPLAVLVGKLVRRPVVVTFLPSMGGNDAGTMKISHSWQSKLRYRLVARLFYAEKFVAISKDIERFFEKDCGIDRRRIAYVALGVDTAEFRPPEAHERKQARACFGLDEDALVCVLPGRLNLNKGHDIAVDAVRSLRVSSPELRVVCLFPGGGDQMAEIHAHALQNDLDIAAFRFLGFVSADVLRNAYWASDIGLLPSRFEGFGLVVAEAMCCGCVPVRTPSGGCEDQILDGSNGFVIPFNNPLALAARISDLADPERRLAMREAAINYASQHLSQDRMIAAIAGVYRDAACAGRTSGG